MKKVLFLVLSILVIACSTCFAATQVQMNDEDGASTMLSKYNQIAQTPNMEMGNEVSGNLILLKRTTNLDGYGSQLQNGNKLMFLCNKSGYVVGCMIMGDDMKSVIRESIVMAIVASNYDAGNQQCSKAIAEAFEHNSTTVWYSQKMNRYYSIGVTNTNGTYRATLISLIK